MMFALGVELLMGRAVMARWDDREASEWPPHPDRVFMALVAAWGEGGAHSGLRGALEWLESLPAPALRVSDQVSARSPIISFVPANDTDVPRLKGKAPSATQMDAGLQVLPDRRNKNGRSFPAVVPDDPTFHLVWPDADAPAAHADALNQLCASVTYLGHSSTPIRMWVEPEPGIPNLVPTNGRATVRLRVATLGRTEYLTNRYNASLRPHPSAWQGYGPNQPAADEAEVAPFHPGLIVLRQTGGRRLSLESFGMVAAAIRHTLMGRHGANAPEWLSGHSADGSPSRATRPACLPLAFVGRPHADGHLLGVALAVPQPFPDDQSAALTALLSCHGEPADVVAEGVGFLRLIVTNPSPGQEEVGEVLLEQDDRPTRQRQTALQPETWSSPALAWATVSPLILPQFPRRGLSPEGVVARACIDAGYPEPVEVRTAFAPFLTGVPHSRTFWVRPRVGRPPRPLVHAAVRFPRPVRGPILVGAGRYAGYGVFRSFDDGGEVS